MESLLKYLLFLNDAASFADENENVKHKDDFQISKYGDLFPT